MPLHRFQPGSRQPRATPMEKLCLATQWGAPLAFVLVDGVLDLGQAVVISEKKKKKKEDFFFLKEQHLLACEKLLAFRLRGLQLIRLRALLLPTAQPSWAGGLKGKESKSSAWHGTARQAHLSGIRHGTGRWTQPWAHWMSDKGEHQLKASLFFGGRRTRFTQRQIQDKPAFC